MYKASYLIIFVLLALICTSQGNADLIFIENPSFEEPKIDPNVFPVSTYADGWTEIDNDIEYSTNTGIFRNTEPNSFDHIINADGEQCAFLGSEAGNGFEQDLDSVYKAGYDYRFSIAIGVSSQYPPSQEDSIDTLEMALFYRDANDPNVQTNIIIKTVEAAGLLSAQLLDFSLYLPTVSPDADYADKNIGIAIRSTGNANGFWTLDNIRLVEMLPVSISIENSSFEEPQIDPNVFPVSTYADGWTEKDNDVEYSTNTGSFRNTEPNSFDHIINVDGSQCAFLGSEQGNGFEQDLDSVYQTGCEYRLTVAVGVSSRYPPSQIDPADALELALFYRDSNDPNVTIDIVTKTVGAVGQLMTLLQDFSLHLDTVSADANFVGKNIGIAIRSIGNANGFWNIDNVRLVELYPVQIPIKNHSFEFPAIDPLNAYGAGPFVDDWVEIDVDPEGLSRNTGVFVNTEPNSFDHIVNADANQLAFLFSDTGNALEQDLDAVYKSGCNYRLTVAIGISSRIPPTDLDPVGTIELALYYRDANDPNVSIDIVSRTIEATGFVPTKLEDYSLYLPTVPVDSSWTENTICIAIRATGVAGGVWTLDNVRLGESLPTQNAVLEGKE